MGRPDAAHSPCTAEADTPLLTEVARPPYMRSKRSEQRKRDGRCRNKAGLHHRCGGQRQEGGTAGNRPGSPQLTCDGSEEISRVQQPGLKSQHHRHNPQTVDQLFSLCVCFLTYAAGKRERCFPACSAPGPVSCNAHGWAALQFRGHREEARLASGPLFLHLEKGPHPEKCSAALEDAEEIVLTENRTLCATRRSCSTTVPSPGFFLGPEVC